MKRDYRISDAEWEVMNVIWDQQPVSSQDVVAALSKSQDWSPATVKTMLHRLAKKNMLTFQQEGNRYIYKAAVRRDACIRHATKSFLQRVFGGEAAPMLSHFVKNVDLSADEIEELRRLLDEQEGK